MTAATRQQGVQMSPTELQNLLNGLTPTDQTNIEWLSAQDIKGSLVGVWAVQGQGGPTAGISCVGGTVGDAEALLQAITAAAAHRGWDEVIFRVPEAQLPLLKDALQAQGWTSRGLRLEWQFPVQALPNDHGTPLSWVSIARLPLPLIYTVLTQLMAEDPLRPPWGTAADWLRAWEDAPNLVGGFWIGFVGQEPVAFAGAQVAPTTGWSRIPYMGVLPHARGQGYGKWAFYRAFTMLKARGGRVWHGGCVANNKAPLNLLKALGGQPNSTLHEWASWVPNRAKRTK